MLWCDSLSLGEVGLIHTIKVVHIPSSSRENSGYGSGQLNHQV
jgi:hypothetical protein